MSFVLLKLLLTVIGCSLEGLILAFALAQKKKNQANFEYPDEQILIA
ncbi:hypothetical protein [Desulfosporosinus shakirovi]|nr:hypothetical protein [Desulfosporosinus sp. SRJS8]MCB8816886.1 hypothetical protein [Desulfosporosinus sp. SRJS8]